MPEILEESGIPLYQQLKNILKGQILSGVLKPGDRIPPETELCAKYGVSRITVRQAIHSLVEEGFLYRKQGKGTFVTSPKQVRLARNSQGKCIGIPVLCRDDGKN